MRIRKLPRWLNRILLVLVTGAWIYNVETMVTGFQQMSLLTRFDAVMLLLLGPVFIWQDFVQQA